jgi:hypothetical protein
VRRRQAALKAATTSARRSASSEAFLSWRSKLPPLRPKWFRPRRRRGWLRRDSTRWWRSWTWSLLHFISRSSVQVVWASL